MEFDFNKLSQGAKLALIGGGVLVINLFLPWFGIAGFSINAFDADFWAWGGSLIAIAGAVVLLLKAMGRSEINAGQFKPEQLATVLAGVGTVFMLLQWLTRTDVPKKFGLYLGIAAGAVVTFGAFSSMRDAGLELPGMSGGGGGDDQPPTPPTPPPGTPPPGG